MATIAYETKEQATQRSREMWESHLGRPKRAEDVTEFLYGVHERQADPEPDYVEPLPDGVDVGIIVNERDNYLDQLLRADQLTDDELAEIVSLYPAWESGVAYAVGDLCAYDDVLYEAVQAHTSQVDWTPDIVPALFVRKSPEGVIPEWVQPTGAQDAYNLGDQVTYEGQVWESTIDANVWAPGVYGWILVE